MATTNLRRFIRYEINLIATIIINNSNSVQCIIRNFCSAGLFLELQPHALINENLIPQQKIKVLFSAGPENESKKISIDSKIMHIRPNGIGILFEDHSDDAYTALKKRSKNCYRATSVSNHKNPENLSKHENLKAKLQSVLREALPPMIQSFIHHTETKLAKDVEEVKNIELNSAIQNAIFNLKTSKDALFKRLCTVDQNTPAQDEKNGTEASLSLIEKPDFEDWLNLSSSIRNLESLYEAQLIQLQKKTTLIFGHNKNDAIAPASPAELCNKLQSSISMVTEDARLKNTLYTLFETTLIEYLPDLYEKMDNTLVEFGVPQKTDKTSSPWSQIEPETEQTKDNYQPAKQNSYLSPPIPETPVTETATPNNTSYIPKANQPVASNYPANTAQPVASNYPANAAQPVVVNQNTKPVINVARNLLSLVKNQNTSQQQLQATENVTELYSTDDVISALTHLQQNSPTNNIQHNTSHALENEILHTLNNSSGSKKTLSNTDQNNIEVYESIFDTLFKDMLLTQDTQSYIQRLQLPIMAQAIPDPVFLESSNHPARNIVNHLYWLGSTVVDNKSTKNTQIRLSVDQMINQIINESPENPDIFTTVEEQLNKITQSVHKSINYNTKRVTEVYKAKQNRENAQYFVEEELNHRFSNSEIPLIIDTLLEAGWEHLLVIAKLKEDNNAFQSYIRTLINLIGWMLGPSRASKEQAETTMEFINTHLQSVCTDTLLHDKILSELKILLPENATQANLDALQVVKPKSKKKAQKTEQRIRHCDEVNRLRTGEWLAVLLDHEIEPLKVVWIAKDSNLFIFVDRNGIQKLELKYKELANLFNIGSANKIESLDLPVMDRAINLMLQKMHKSLLNKATQDPVTGLLNRKELIKQLKHELPRLSDAQHFLCNIEIQDFRIITNACGFSGGDALLKKLADLLKSDLQKNDIIARLDDKTFSILLKDYSDETDNAAENIAKKLQSSLLSTPFTWKDKSYAIAVGIGIIPLAPALAHDLGKLLKNVDSATLSAINTGRNCIKVFHEDDESLKSQFNEFDWAARINQVFSDDRLFLRCQKISAIDPDAGRHTHYEILLGIKDENNNIIPPDDFIPGVERCQRMSEIDRWVVQNVFSWIEENQLDFEMLNGFSINLSGESMNSEDFLNFLKNTLTSSNIPLEKITFEITETVAAGSFQFVQSFIKQIKEFNCKFSLDDFGTGYSSYAYLKSLDVDYLKIDGAFVKDILNNDSDVAIVKSMNEIAHSLGLETIAEYVENEEILNQLQEIGVDFAQGWGIHKPMPLNDLNVINDLDKSGVR
jgi:diguanylate cyclase (GGDEF)-like protein